MRSLFYIFISLIISLEHIYAAYQLEPPTTTDPLVGAGDSGIGIIILSRFISYFIGLAGVLGVIGITWGGVLMVFAVGDDEKVKKGRYTIIYSLIGVLVAGMAYGIVEIVSDIRIS